jgi:hypothetical protein
MKGMRLESWFVFLVVDIGERNIPAESRKSRRETHPSNRKSHRRNGETPTLPKEAFRNSKILELFCL